MLWRVSIPEDRNGIASYNQWCEEIGIHDDESLWAWVFDTMPDGSHFVSRGDMYVTYHVPDGEMPSPDLVDCPLLVEMFLEREPEDGEDE